MVARRGWQQIAAELIQAIDDLAGACAQRQLTTIEIKHAWIALLPVVQAIIESGKGHDPLLKHLQQSVAALVEACRQRGGDQTPQARFAEARLNACRALCENHNPALDNHPGLVESFREICSQETADYLLQEVGLVPDQYLDGLGMMAQDGAKPEEVVNPPARIRSALLREQNRRSRRDLRRIAGELRWDRQRALLRHHKERWRPTEPPA